MRSQPRKRLSQQTSLSPAQRSNRHESNHVPSHASTLGQLVDPTEHPVVLLDPIRDGMVIGNFIAAAVYGTKRRSHK